MMKEKVKVRYLKKKKLYEIAKSLIKAELPLSRNCEYSFYGGRECLVCGDYTISSLDCGSWMQIKQSLFDEEKDAFVVNTEIYSGFSDGKYHYHSINGNLVSSVV